MRTIGQRREALRADIYPGGIVTRRQGNGVPLDAETDEPASRFTLDGDGFNVAVQWAMKLNLYVSSPLDAELCIVEQAAPVAVARVGNAVISPERTIPWKSWLLAAFDASKKCLVCLIKTAQYVLRACEVGEGQAAISAHRLQLIRLIVIRDRLPACFPGIVALLLRRIVKGAGLLELVFQKLGLAFGWVKTVFENKAHSVLRFKKVVDASSNQLCIGEASLLGQCFECCKLRLSKEAALKSASEQVM
jgi:hypothetical protein